VGRAAVAERPAAPAARPKIDYYRARRALWARVGWPLELGRPNFRPKQEEVWRSLLKKKITVFSTGIQGPGKTSVAVRFIAARAVLSSGVHWYIVPKYEIAKQAIAYLKEFLAPGSPLVRRFSESYPISIEVVSRSGEVSMIEFRTAADPDALRARKVRSVVIDEAAFLKEDVFDVAMGRGATYEDFRILLCSTPKGIRSWFHKYAKRGEAGDADVGFVAAKTEENPEVPRAVIDEARARLHPLVFAQEYEGKFVDLYGIPFFDLFALDALEAAAVGGETFRLEGDELVPHAGGPVEIIEEPEDEGYIAGVDTSEGAADACRGQILRRSTRQVVARWGGVMDPGAFAEIGIAVCRKYRIMKGRVGSTASVETNGPGLVVIDRFLAAGVRVHRSRSTPEKVHQRLGEYGVRTTPATRPGLLQRVLDFVSGREGVLPPAVVGEMRSFVLDEAGRPAAAEGCLDDEVFALAQALAADAEEPPFRRVERPDRRPDLVSGKFRPEVEAPTRRLRPGWVA